jgi:hypothetical protein
MKKNKEIIINSINDEFDGKRKKLNKRRLKDMISLEEFLLKYYDRYDFAIKYCNYYSCGFRRYGHHNGKVIFYGRFDNDIELIKFIDEYRLDNIFVDNLDGFISSGEYFSDDIDIWFDEKIYIEIYQFVLSGVI